MSRGHSGAVVRVVAQGEVTGVNRVDVEVDRDGRAGHADAFDGPSGRPDRICADLSVTGMAQLRAGSQCGLVEAVRVRGVVAKKGQLVVGEHRHLPSDPGQRSIGDPE